MSSSHLKTWGDGPSFSLSVGANPFHGLTTRGVLSSRFSSPAAPGWRR